MTRERDIVLVTGLPRSGTTVVGDVLGSAAGCMSLYEPMNPQSGDVRFTESFAIAQTPTIPAAALDTFLEDLKRLRLRLRSGVFPHETGLRAIAKRVVGGRSRASLRLSRLTPWADTLVWKDPFALFCMPDLLERGLRIVMTYRPPEAIAASYKRLNWTFPVEEIVKRLELRGWGHLAEGYPASKPATIKREVYCAALLWGASVRLAVELSGRDDAPLVAETGRFHLDPIRKFSAIFDHCDLLLGPAAERRIRRLFAARDAVGPVPSGHPHSRRRNPSTVNTYWKHVLSEDEIAFVSDIRGITEFSEDAFFARAGSENARID